MRKERRCSTWIMKCKTEAERVQEQQQPRESEEMEGRWKKKNREIISPNDPLLSTLA